MRIVLDFTAFVSIFLRVANGALKSLTIRNAMKELKSNLKVFEEINDINEGQNPVHGVRLITFGGSPVTCVFLLMGVQGTPYEGIKTYFLYAIICLQMFAAS